MYSLYRLRHAFSWIPVIAAAGWMMFNNPLTLLKVQPRYDETTMEVALVELPAEQPDPEPQAESSPSEPPPLPEPIPEPPPVTNAPASEPIAPPPRVKPQLKAEPKPQPKPKPVTKQKPATEPRPAEKSVQSNTHPTVNKKPAAPVIPSAPAVNAAALENGWIAALRRDLEAQKRYPTGRQASLERPEGQVEVWLEVDRSGRVLDSGVTTKARSMLLNRAAASSLQNIKQVRPFPADAFAGQRTKRFTATFNYRAP
ncbi:energy transducer TonB [Pantoea sp. Acro-805]|uniref:Energy transducer TonB n=1 Tax=Candidatus Pantoea formicae TaxID=2608355 RepID=A0ABX0QXN5_9GAMM|nr:energy transducer TonB [Pantoea formicae]NIF00370.1 energy transducer TonB [Pantoea formicae]